MKIRENVPISELTTMRLGGPARFVIEIKQESDIPEAYIFAQEKNLPVYILGSGSNIIGRDKGFNGVILVNKLIGMGEVENLADFEFSEAISTGSDTDANSDNITEMVAKDEKLFWAASGEPLDDFVRYVCKRDYSGIECLSAIPGTVGAAPVQNVGAYGQEIKNTLVLTRVFDTKEKKFTNFTTDKLDLSYRHSIFNSGDEVGRYFITKVVVKLKKTQLEPPFYNSLQKYLDEHHIEDYTPENIRKAVQVVRDGKLPNPDFIASSGSFFKNVYLNEEDSAAAKAKDIPVWDGGKIPAGWLLENAGLKGKLLHGMRVWETASLVLVNENAQKYQDLADAREEIVETVKKKFGYTLEQEPMELGDE